MGRNGLIVIDKPAGWTSHDVVARLRGILREKSIGHLGTLDPMATGLLPLVLGRWTRLAQFYGGAGKTYTGRIRFGFATNTYDAEGEPAEPSGNASNLSLATIREAATRFVGTLQQTPPPFSAKKIGGVPAYKLARKQQPVELKPVEITVHRLELDDWNGESVAFSVEVSSGTYIRSIAHELGIALGTGAHLAALRRTHFGDFVETDSHTLEEIEAAADDTENLFFHPRRILPSLPSVTATPEAVGYLRNGRAVNLPEYSTAPLVKVFANQLDLIAICHRMAGTLFKPKVVLWSGNDAMPVVVPR
jgi:tRNA pseudouridine55 synthase